MSGKRLALVLGMIFFSWTNVANAETDTENIENNEILRISEKNTYDFKKDPFLLSLAFVQKDVIEEPKAAESREETPEEKILSRWRAKQPEKWASLPKGKFVVNASAYTASADECGNDKGITASGLLVKKQQTLACPPEFPFGARVAIEGVGVLRCEDRGGAIKGNHFDIYMETKTEAFAFGRRNLVAEVIVD